MQKTTTFLMFVRDKAGKAEEAVNLYTSQFPNSEIRVMMKYTNPDRAAIREWFSRRFSLCRVTRADSCYGLSWSHSV
jgi:predicted 3-demethylubiquinone-9 3-methyltransferase (glyoxalase superfamily)